MDEGDGEEDDEDSVSANAETFEAFDKDVVHVRTVQKKYLACKLQEYNMLVPYGSFTFNYEGSKIIVTTIREGPCLAPNQRVPTCYWELHIGFPSKEVAKEFCKEFVIWRENRKEDDEGLFYFALRPRHRHIEWERSKLEHAPSIANVFINADMKQNILTRIDVFEKSKSKAKKFGKPLKLNMLFYGIPGSGKTSLVKALAKHTDKSLYVFSFTKELTDADFTNLYSQIKDNSIVVLEDVDSFFHKRDSQCNVSFSNLINVLDGIQTSEKSIINIVTANFPEVLDTALIRPGRMDMLLKFDYPTKEEIKKAFEAYIPNASESDFEAFFKRVKSIKCPMSALTDYLFRYEEDYLEHCSELSGHMESLEEIQKDNQKSMYL